ncbi:MAG: UDP-3-O-acyl-N-acetylglucosamine deacetylase, partial [Pseudomonadota bacterium]
MSHIEYQSTLKDTVVCAGIGVHSGARARMTIKPAPIGTGIQFLRTDMAGTAAIPAHAEIVTELQLGTTLSGDDGASVATVEHFMAACAGLGLDNLLVEIDGPEVPIMDGSSAVFCELMLGVGLKRQSGLRRRIRILDT